MFGDGHWYVARDADPRALGLFKRHYTYRRTRKPGTMHFIGPGRKLVLLTVGCDALFAWRRCEIRDDGQEGVECAVFRNEGAIRSSDLIREASAIAWLHWPGERLFTFVNPRKVRSKEPGKCFVKAGWTRLPGLTKKRKLVVLECLP